MRQDKRSVAPPMIGETSGGRTLAALGPRERGTLASLLASGKIGGAELLAANRWYEAFAMAEHGAFDADKAGTGSSVKLFAQERQIAAATSYRLTREALGQAGDGRMRAILGDGMSMAALARLLRQIPHMVTGMVVADLVRLVEHYAALDNGKSRRKTME